MTVVGPDGNLWSTGEPRVQGAVISIDLMPLGPAGTYTVNYRVTSADGHVVSGSWPFHLTTAGTGNPGRRPRRRRQAGWNTGMAIPAAGAVIEWPAPGGRCADGRKCADSKDFDAIGLDQVRSRSRTAPCARESRAHCHPRLAASR